MSNFTLLLLCVQACFIQAVFGCVCRPVASAPYIGGARIPGNLGYGNLGNTAAVYGGEGFGDISVTGQFDVTGNTYVTGQIPVLGQVGFCGDVPARGAGTIFGSCGSSCGCRY